VVKKSEGSNFSLDMSSLGHYHNNIFVLQIINGQPRKKNLFLNVGITSLMQVYFGLIHGSIIIITIIMKFKN